MDIVPAIARAIKVSVNDKKPYVVYSQWGKPVIKQKPSYYTHSLYGDYYLVHGYQVIKKTTKAG